MAQTLEFPTPGGVTLEKKAADADYYNDDAAPESVSKVDDDTVSNDDAVPESA